MENAFSSNAFAVSGGLSQSAADARYVLKAAGSFTGLTGAGFRDASAAFDVTLAFNSSSSALTAGRALTIDMGNVAHTIALGTTAGTITFPNIAAMTVAGLQIANTFTLAQTVAFGIAAATQGNGLVLQNTTAATNGNQTWSPSLRLTGNQFASGASRTCEFLLTCVPVQQNFDHNILRISTKHGADALTTLLYIRNLNGAPYIEPPSAAALTIGGTAGNSSLKFQFNGNVVAQIGLASTFSFEDATNLAVGTTTGTKLGTATTQKLAFWNKTPIVQPTTAITGATVVHVGGATYQEDDTIGGYTIAQVVAALVNTGILA